MYELFWFTGGILTVSVLFCGLAVWVVLRWKSVIAKKNETIESLQEDFEEAETAKRCAIQALRDRDGRVWPGVGTPAWQGAQNGTPA